VSDSTFANSPGYSTTGHPRAFDTIVLGGLAIGIGDFLFAVIFYGMILGVRQIRIFQSVASGVLARASFDGGIKTYILGLFLHFVVATCIATVYYLLSSRLSFLIQHAVVSGLVYGMIAYLVMNYIVIPLSRARSGPFSWRTFIPAFIAHALLVGLPVALIARRSANRS
jgi:hypothetical protein